MKKELLELIDNFEAAVDDFNEKKSPIDDEVELTFLNFIKWLRWNEL